MDRTIISVASGKGGTEKTTLATNLARVASMNGLDVSYLDCDVEEPNGHIFLKPDIEKTEPVCVPVPIVDEDKCTACGKCAEICQYSAIALLGKTVLTFPNLCHACGGCMLVCPAGAITETGREVGIVEEGMAGGVRFVHGKLRIGEVMSPPLIRAVRKRIREDGLTIIDAVPGTSCPVIQSVKGSDYVVLVTEPTLSGLHDLERVADLAAHFKIPIAVCVNKSDINSEMTDRIREHCLGKNIDMLGEIRYDTAVTRARIQCRSVVEYDAGLASSDIRSLLDAVKQRPQDQQKG